VDKDRAGDGKKPDNGLTGGVASTGRAQGPVLEPAGEECGVSNRVSKYQVSTYRMRQESQAWAREM
jgi:hypothetical protein